VEGLDLTSLTVDELRQLVPPFEAVFQAQMAQWRLDGQPRTVLRYTTYTTSCHGRGSTRSAGAYAHPFQLGQQQGDVIDAFADDAQSLGHAESLPRCTRPL